MNIRRATRPNQYTNIDNDVINDPRLSAAALGVLIYLLSKFDNWTANKKHLLKRFKTGYNKLSVNGLDNCFKELRNAGYAELVPVMKKNAKGKMYFSGSEYVIYDKAKIEYSPRPKDLPEPENIPSPEDSPRPEILEAPKSLGVIITNKEDTITNKEDINGKIDLPEASAPSFDDFWNLYNYKKNRKAAEKSWKRLTPTKKSAALAGVPQYLAYLNYSGHSQCHGATWINGERWNDDNSIQKATTPQTKNLVDSYTTHLEKYLTEKQRKSLNGKIQGFLSIAGQDAVQSEISGLKWKFGEIANKSFTEALIFDICYGTLARCGRNPENRFSKFRQFYNGLKNWDQNQSDLRTEFKKYIS